jgi:hypothetical protein
MLHPTLDTVTGTVYVDAATVQLPLADGSTSTLPVVERMFLGSFSKGTKVTQVTAYDKAGDPRRPHRAVTLRTGRCLVAQTEARLLCGPGTHVTRSLR